MEPRDLAPNPSMCFCPPRVTRTSALAWECWERQGWVPLSPRECCPALNMWLPVRVRCRTG